MEIVEHRIREGFPGQRILVLPRPIVSSWLKSDPLIDLVPTDVGHFPHAKWHFVERNGGTSETIVIHCVEGAGWSQLGNGQTFPLRAGQVLVIPRDMPHSYGADADEPWTIYFVHVGGGRAEALPRMLEIDAATPVLYHGSDPTLVSLFETILTTLGRSYSADNLLQASMALGQMIAHLVVNRHRQPNADGSMEARIERVIDAMHRHVDGRINVDDLAGDAHLSRSHFAAVFKKRTGFPVLNFFTRIRMQRACFLLDTTNMPIKAIAAELGFDDPLYFSRAFHRIHDMSPMQYRAIRKG